MMSVLADVNVSNGMAYIGDQIRSFCRRNSDSYERSRPPYISQICTFTLVLCILFFVVTLPSLFYLKAFDGNNAVAWITMLCVVGVFMFCSLIIIILECLRPSYSSLCDSIDTVDVYY